MVELVTIKSNIKDTVNEKLAHNKVSLDQWYFELINWLAIKPIDDKLIITEDGRYLTFHLTVVRDDVAIVIPDDQELIAIISKDRKLQERSVQIIQSLIDEANEGLLHANFANIPDANVLWDGKERKWSFSSNTDNVDHNTIQLVREIDSSIIDWENLLR